MCSNDSPPRLPTVLTSSAPVTPSALLPYPLSALKQLNDTGTGGSPVCGPSTMIPPAQAALEHYRLQLYNYAVAERLRLAHPALLASPFAAGLGVTAAGARAQDWYPYFKYADPRLFRAQEEPKPQHSYIGLIAMAILSSPDKKLVLSDIYQYILDNYSYFRSRGPGWRNSIRHNLSLNDCFVKAGRSANGKGHYWAIHPANIDDFQKGDFRRRKAQRKVRRHMGLAVDDDDSPSPTPPPSPPHHHQPPHVAPTSPWVCPRPLPPIQAPIPLIQLTQDVKDSSGIRKRQFDVASLLAPDEAADSADKPSKIRVTDDDEDIDVVSNDEKPSASESPLWTPTSENEPHSPINFVSLNRNIQQIRPFLPLTIPQHQHSQLNSESQANLSRVFAASFASVEELNRYYEQLRHSTALQQHVRSAISISASATSPTDNSEVRQAISKH